MRALSQHFLVGLATVALCAAAPSASAQDLYDTTVLRAINLTFHDANWLTLLRQNYASQTYILANLEVENVVYPDVGVRIRGNSSYWRLPSGSQKFPLNVELDFVHPDQTLMGYKTLNLNNGWRDPTFCREVVYINSENWGVYLNVQQFDKTMLGTTFPDADGLRIKCPNDPNGPGLLYNGPAPSGYTTSYEIKNDGGLADPWGALIAVCNAVTNEPLSTWENIDLLFAIDPSIWSVVLENFLSDDDSYVHKGADFMTYRDPTDGRMFLLQTDANETFIHTTWSPTRNFTAFNKPVLSHVLAVPELRQRYMGHYRTVKTDLTWAYFEPIFIAHRNLIDAAVQADPKKLYSYQLFLENFTNTVVMPYGGSAGGPIVGLQEFIEDRASFLDANSELTAAGPTIDSLRVSDPSPDPADPVTVTAWVTPAGGGAIDKVEVFYRPSPGEVYQRVEMTDNGPAGYSVVLPLAATAGQRVAYYVAATSTNTHASMSFSPARTEWDPLYVEYTFGTTGGMRITEWMYSGTGGEFIEFTNMSEGAIDMNGWSFDDDHGVAGTFDLSAFGVVQMGESVVLTESPAENFRAAWGLAPSVKIIGDLGRVIGNNLARNDEINLYDASNDLVDRLRYGDQTFPGTIRARYASGQTCCQFIGQNDVHAWQLSTVGDIFGSYPASTADVGTPGTYDPSLCLGCDATGVVASDPHPPANAWLAPSQPNPFSESTRIPFRLDQQRMVRLTIFDASGRQVRRLASDRFAAGGHAVVWDGADDTGRPVPTGIYFAHLAAGTEAMTRKFVRVR
jgi:hypothetical protein